MDEFAPTERIEPTHAESERPGARSHTVQRPLSVLPSPCPFSRRRPFCVRPPPSLPLSVVVGCPSVRTNVHPRARRQSCVRPSVRTSCRQPPL